MIKIIKKERIAYTYTVDIDGETFVYEDLEAAKRYIKTCKLAELLFNKTILYSTDAEKIAGELLENEKEIKAILDSIGVEIVE